MTETKRIMDLVSQQISLNVSEKKTGGIKIEFYKGGVSSLILEEMIAPDTFVRRKVIGLKKA